jgi:hypothetical protein
MVLYTIDFENYIKLNWRGGYGEHTVIGILSFFNLVVKFLLENQNIFCMIDIDQLEL